jgi:nucleolar protein 58
MILRHHRPPQVLAVGKSEYKTIIKTNLGDVPCRFDETVMEVMWGLQNLMHGFLPEEAKEERLPICQGIKIFLDPYGFDVKPEMVNEEIVSAACILFDVELIVKKHSKFLSFVAEELKDFAGINSEGWSTTKIAKALKIMVKPLGTSEAEMKMFTGDELSMLMRDKYKFEDLISRDNILKIHQELFFCEEVKKDTLEILGDFFI